MSVGVKKCWQNTMTVLQETFIRSSQVTNHESVRMSPKQSNRPSCRSLNPSQIQRKLFVEKSLRSKWWPISSAKQIMWRLFYLSIVERSIPSGTTQFVRLKSSEKFEQRTREDESLFTMEISHIGSNQRLIDWPKRRIDGSSAAEP